MQQNRAQLLRRESPVERNKRRTNPDASEEKLGHFMPVSSDNRNAMSATNPFFSQNRHPPVAGSVELRIRQASTATSIYEGDPVRSDPAPLPKWIGVSRELRPHNSFRTGHARRCSSRNRMISRVASGPRSSV